MPVRRPATMAGAIRVLAALTEIDPADRTDSLAVAIDAYVKTGQLNGNVQR